jgi:DNA-binding CsgD family transcriptional regulator
MKIVSQLEQLMPIWKLDEPGASRFIVNMNNTTTRWKPERPVQPVKSDLLKSLLKNNNTSSIFLVNEPFAHSMLLEALYIIIQCVRHGTTYIGTDKISADVTVFLRRLGVQGIVASYEADKPWRELEFNNRCSINISTSVKQVERTNKNELFYYNLSPSEIEVFYFISIGLTNPQISDLIHKSYHTIKNHKINIAKKTGLKSNELLALSLQIQHTHQSIG